MLKIFHKNIIWIVTVFIIASAIGFYCENSYRILVRYLFRLLTSNSIIFVGKDFHILPETSFVISFGIFCSIFINSLLRDSIKIILIKISIVIVLFFITTLISTFVDGTYSIMECTKCDDGIRRLNYNDVNYSLHFILSLLIAIIPTLFIILKTRKANKLNAYL